MQKKTDRSVVLMAAFFGNDFLSVVNFLIFVLPLYWNCFICWSTDELGNQKGMFNGICIKIQSEVRCFSVQKLCCWSYEDGISVTFSSRLFVRFSIKCRFCDVRKYFSLRWIIANHTWCWRADCEIQLTLVISNSLISNNRLSRSENLVPA